MAVKFEAESFKKITLDAMRDYIEENYPKDKAWFKKVAFEDKEGNKVEKYNHLNAVRKFCEKYAPELLPKAEPKVPATKRIENW
jgi:hypothetical protein